jgi:NADH-quinone oxidoreductase subunit K
MVDYVILSMTLLAIGIYGLLTKRNLVKLLISIELISIAATMNFVLLGTTFSKELGEAFLVIAFSTDSCITATALALFITIAKKYGTTDIKQITDLRQQKNQERNEPTLDRNGDV